jgi:hypothetical protein
MAASATDFRNDRKEMKQKKRKLKRMMKSTSERKPTLWMRLNFPKKLRLAWYTPEIPVSQGPEGY